MTKKSVPHCIVHACMNGLFFLTTELHRSFSSYITFTTLLQHSFGLYITFTTLLHHLYITFTSFLQLIRHFHPLCHLYITPFLNVLTAGFPAAPARSHSYAINCPPVHRFRQGERYSFLGWGLNSGRNLMPGSRLHNDSQPQKSSAPF